MRQNRLDWGMKLSAAYLLGIASCTGNDPAEQPRAALKRPELTAPALPRETSKEPNAVAAAQPTPDASTPLMAADVGKAVLDAAAPPDPRHEAAPADVVSNSDSDDAGCAESMGNALSVSSFGNSTCALVRGGTARCWGWNQAGTLGDGSHIDRVLPSQVRDLRGVVQLDVGYLFACALLDDGTVRCWGNDWGPLLDPNGDGSGISSPVVMPGLRDVAQVSVGEQQLCVRHRDGTLQCSLSVSRAGVLDGNGSSDVVDVEAGYFITTARFANGSVRSWGTNPAPSDSASPIVQIGSGYAFVCALRADKTVTCSNGDPLLHGVQQIAAGFEHSCALLADASVHCWGHNEHGQLGDGSTTATYEPTAVIGLPPTVEITAGRAHTCARTEEGAVYCWGDNQYGQLGDGTKATRRRPVFVRGL